MKKQQPTSVTSEDEPRHLYHVSTGIQSTPELAEAAVQCESDHVFVHALLDQIDRLEAKCTSLKSQLISNTFCIERFVENDRDVAYYTGFPTYEMLMIFWRYLGEKVNHLTHWRGRRPISMEHSLHLQKVETH